jgi:hypothetical protein
LLLIESEFQSSICAGSFFTSGWFRKFCAFKTGGLVEFAAVEFGWCAEDNKVSTIKFNKYLKISTLICYWHANFITLNIAKWIVFFKFTAPTP